MQEGLFSMLVVTDIARLAIDMVLISRDLMLHFVFLPHSQKSVQEWVSPP